MPTRLPRRTRTALTLTRIGLWAERITRGFWPLLSVCLLILGVLLLFSPDLWSVEVLWTAIAVAAAGLIYALHYAWRNFHRPGTGEAHARLDATLVNRPLKAIQDTPALGGDDPAALAVWQVHMDRMHAQASDAVAVSPDLRAAKYDPYALRYVACLFAMIGLMFGSIYSIREISLPAGGTVETGPSWEGWVQPPSYTGLPTIYLNDVIGQTLTVPQDSA
ncbi:MAG: DUF4175 family protein, partial [Planktomarina sp.]